MSPPPPLAMATPVEHMQRHAVSICAFLNIHEPYTRRTSEPSGLDRVSGSAPRWYVSGVALRKDKAFWVFSALRGVTLWAVGAREDATRRNVGTSMDTNTLKLLVKQAAACAAMAAAAAALAASPSAAAWQPAGCTGGGGRRRVGCSSYLVRRRRRRPRPRGGHGGAPRP